MRNRSSAWGAAGRWIVLVVAAVYFIGPFLAALWFTVHRAGHGVSFAAYKEIFKSGGIGQVGFGAALAFSLVLSVVTIAFTLAVMVPTQVLLRLRFPRTRALVEVLCLLPLVFPPVVLVVGVNSIYGAAAPAPNHPGSPFFHVLAWIKDQSHPALLVLLYTVMSLPYVFRTIDSGLRAIDVRTLVEASRSLGAGWGRTIFSVIVASLRTSLLNAGFLVFALVMGEFTVASILLYTKPFSVWLVQLPSTSGQVQAAVSVLALLLVEAILVVITLGSTGLRARAEQKARSELKEVLA